MDLQNSPRIKISNDYDIVPESSRSCNILRRFAYAQSRFFESTFLYGSSFIKRENLGLVDDLGVSLSLIDCSRNENLNPIYQYIPICKYIIYKIYYRYP
ncbi:hypothetical protein F8M41_005978 [Gigaspora margarita]|uniref:Uncharacterized protein n=1 Tax=Gigaspora margarita TaxID=4874 RepID=A0A8H3X809_GIGMA|nr:hypothetical protein F8M41_005978 [Gigaspora margarita]